MLRDLLKQTLVELSGNDVYPAKALSKLKKYVENLQNVIKESKLEEDPFNTTEYKFHPNVKRLGTSLTEVIFSGDKYSIIIHASIAEDSSKSYQNSGTLIVVGYSSDISKNNRQNLEVLSAIAEQNKCKFNCNKDYAVFKTNRINSGVINLESNPSAMNNIGEIIENVRKASVDCDKYFKDINDLASKYTHKKYHTIEDLGRIMGYKKGE